MPCDFPHLPRLHSASPEAWMNLNMVIVAAVTVATIRDTRSTTPSTTVSWSGLGLGYWRDRSTSQYQSGSITSAGM